MSTLRRAALTVGASILVLGLLTSCQRLLPDYVRLDTDGTLRFGACYSLEAVNSVELVLTNPVDGDPRSFEKNVVTFTGPAFDLEEGESFGLPLVADGWTADRAYESFADWTYASVVLYEAGGGSVASGGFGRSDLEPGVWTRLGSDFEGCSPPK